MSDRKEEADLLYGADAIGTFLGMTLRQARHRITVGDIPFFKMGRSVCASRAALRAWIAARAAGPDHTRREV